MSYSRSLLSPTVLVLSYYYPPANTSGVFRTLYFFNHIARRGKWKVCVLTLDTDCYHVMQNKDQYLLEQVAPEIRLYTARAVFPRESIISLKRNFYKKGKREQDARGEPIILSPVQSRKSNGWWQKLKDILTEEILSFPDNKVGWVPFAYREACKIIKEQGVKVIYSTGSPWSSHLLGYFLKKRTGLPLVLDYRDPWYGNPYSARSVSNIYHKALFRVEKIIINSADRVLCNTKRLQIFYQQIFGSEEKFFTLPNGYEQDIRKDQSFRKNPDEFVVVHAGSLYGGRNPENFLRAVIRLADKSEMPKIRVILVGAEESVRNSIAKKYGPSVLDELLIVTSRVTHEKCLSYLRTADVLLLFQQGTSLQVPRKLYEYMALRKPILAICDEGETEDIINAYRLGLSVRDNEHAIETALSTFISSPRVLSPEPGAYRKFSNITLARQLESHLEEIMARGVG